MVYIKRFECVSETILNYYFASSQRIAVRENNELTFLLADHLGSTVGTVNSSGNLGSQTRYTAFGETRGAATTSTDYLYTGQRQEGEIGLYFYNARWYDPALSRFIQADTIVPQPGDALTWDRYAYVKNNSIRFNDPSGHCPECLVMGGIMGVGALIGYGTQVYNNFQNGLTGFSAFSTNIQLEPIWKGAIIAGSVAIASAAVVTAISSFGPTIGAITGVACADGDCSNEGKNIVDLIQIGNKYSSDNKGIGFNSFYEFKKFYGPAGPGMAWHHIVEQNSANIRSFGANAIHNSSNIIKLPSGKGSLHAVISGYYSSIQPWITGSDQLTVRQWLQSQSFDQQMKFGIQIINSFGGEKFLIK